MINLEVRHCEIRGEEIAPPHYVNVNDYAAAEAYMNSLPHVRGKEYYYAKLKINDKPVVIDPTFNHRYNLQQRFIRTVLGK